MKFSRRRFLSVASGALALPAISRNAMAQAWPSRIVKLVVGFPPGGGADSVSRIVAARLSEVWGQQVVVENKPGAGSNLAIDTVAHADPDGYTMLMTVRAPGISRFLFSSLTYDPDADLTAVCQLGTYVHLLVVPNNSPVKTLQEFIANTKANPGKVTYASPGVSTPSHLTAELLKRTAGFEMTHVPYRGVAAGAMNDLIAGRIDAMMNTTGSLLQAARSGQVRGLAVSSAKRSALSDEFPGMMESGVSGFDVSSWYALFAPAKIPADILKKINADTAAILTEPAMKTKLAPLGIMAAGSTPAELNAKTRSDTELWGGIIKSANIKGE